MNVRQFMERVKDVRLAREKVAKFDANRGMAEFILTETDCQHIQMYLEDYENGLLNREVVGKFDGV